jgi:hypothetical protein
MLSPRQAFEDNIRPAELLLRVYRLLETDSIETSGDMITKLRQVVGCDSSEELMLLYNEVFLGLIRERAQIPAAALKRSALDNLLRQGVVSASTALETYLPSLLRTNLPAVINAKGREFIPPDGDLNEYFNDLTFDLPETSESFRSRKPRHSLLQIEYLALRISNISARGKASMLLERFWDLKSHGNKLPINSSGRGRI